MTTRLQTLLPLALTVTLGTAGLVGGCTSEHPLTTSQPATNTTDAERPHLLEKNGTAFPGLIPLSNGFAPEGIAVGSGTTFFVGSLVNGSIYKGDLRNGEGEILVSPPGERIAVGLAFDRRSNQLFVAGGGNGEAYVYNAETGKSVAAYQLTDPGPDTFVNDAVVTRTAAFFTDSFQPVIYRIPLGPGGRLPESGAVEELPLSGDFQSVEGFNSNGIDAPPDGKHLIVVNSALGTLYRVDPATGEASSIELGGEDVTFGDGILLDGRTLYVVRNQLNQIAVVMLSPDLLFGQVTGTITSDDFDVPTTVAEFGSDLYAVNARFGTEPGPSTEYHVVRVAKE